MKEETIERTSAIGSKKEAAITEEKREREKSSIKGVELGRG